MSVSEKVNASGNELHVDLLATISNADPVEVELRETTDGEREVCPAVEDVRLVLLFLVKKFIVPAMLKGLFLLWIRVIFARYNRSIHTRSDQQNLDKRSFSWTDFLKRESRAVAERGEHSTEIGL